MNDITLAVIDGNITTTSNQIAEHFGKAHKSVLRAIANLDCSPEFTERNFAPSEFTDSTGRALPAYTITRDGFVFLCMGFTGKDAAQWKEKYIAAFNAMEARLRSPAAPTPPQALPAPKEGLSKALRAHINRTAHQAALSQYDTIQSIFTTLATDNIACGATEEACFGYINNEANVASGVALVNRRDLDQLVHHASLVINEAGYAIAAIIRIEQRSGLKLFHGVGKSPYVSADFHKHDRLVESVLNLMAGGSE